MPEQGLQEYLKRLEAQRATVTIQIAGVRAELGLPAEDGMAATGIPVSPSAGDGARDIVTGRIRPDEFFRMSIPEAIKRFMEIMKQPQAPKAIADGLQAGGILSESKHFYANVFTALKRMRSQGVVVNTKKGWGLAEWYAGRSGVLSESKPKRPRRGKAPKGAPAKPSAYRTFLSEQMKAGKSMKDA